MEGSDGGDDAAEADLVPAVGLAVAVAVDRDAVEHESIGRRGGERASRDKAYRFLPEINVAERSRWTTSSRLPKRRSRPALTRRQIPSRARDLAHVGDRPHGEKRSVLTGLHARRELRATSSAASWSEIDRRKPTPG